MTSGPLGFAKFLERPFVDTLWKRRTHRISKGIRSIPAGSMSYASPHKPQPLDELEEAILIAATGATGLTMPDRPFQDADGAFIMAKPNLTMEGRSAGSPDNAQGTHFFLINDSGTYFLRHVPAAGEDLAFTPENLVARARRAKQQVLDRRLDVKREFPAYLDSNRFLSNLPGTTILLPIVDLTRQYINGLMYLLTQPDGTRPTFVDDRNFYRIAGVKKWVRKGFLNRNIKVPLGALGTLRTHIEADLLLQNLMLTAEAMGLGAWIHAAIAPPVMLGHPMYRDQFGPGLGFHFQVPRFRLLDLFRWGSLFPKTRANPVGLDGVLEGFGPPYQSISEAVDAVVQMKFGPKGIYNDAELFGRIYKHDYGERYRREAPAYSDQVIACVRDLCNYIFDTHGRFPAHVDAMFVPGVWLQVHHIEEEYYEKFFQTGLTDAHRHHQQWWH